MFSVCPLDVDVSGRLEGEQMQEILFLQIGNSKDLQNVRMESIRKTVSITLLTQVRNGQKSSKK